MKPYLTQAATLALVRRKRIIAPKGHMLNTVVRKRPSLQLCHHSLMASDDLNLRQRRSVPEKAGLRHPMQRCDPVSPTAKVINLTPIRLAI